MLCLWILVVFCVCLLFLFISIKRHKNFPPGPQPIPIFGNLFHFNIKNPLKDLDKFAEQYGTIYSLYIGTKPTVFLHGFQTIKEALVTKSVDFAGRPQSLLKDVHEGKGVIMADYGPQWKEHRRFALMTLRNFGLGKQSMEYRIQGEIEHLVTNLKKYAGDSMYPQSLMHDAASNIIYLILFGTRYNYERCQQEIDEILHGKTQPSFEDRHNMPYTQAVIHECQRVANIVPLAGFHCTTRDTELLGYNIPKGTMVIPNLSSVLSEEGQWKFPHDFNPSNFLNDQGQFEKPEAFLPFSSGLRVCLGEGLARMELFLFLVTLLHRFQFIWPKDAEPDFNPIFGLSMKPKPYNMEIRLRQPVRDKLD